MTLTYKCIYGKQNYIFLSLHGTFGLSDQLCTGKKIMAVGVKSPEMIRRDVQMYVLCTLYSLKLFC